MTRAARTLIAGTTALALAVLTLPLALGAPRPAAPTSAGAQASPTFTDATAAAGIRFRHESGAFGKKYLPETMGSGVAFLDYDGDGRQDLLFVNGKRWPGRPGSPSYPALYRNQGDGTFRDVTRAAGLAIEMYGLGVSVADYDNDGDPDVYLTALGPNRLFRNEGGGSFRDVTPKAGAGDPGFSTSAAFFDYDKDGRLDLFVCNYVEWSIEKDLTCTLNGRDKSYCTPESYKGQSSTLYRNRGDGTFEDVTVRAGLRDPSSKSLGVAVVDFDDDSWPDLFVANDTQPNKLYRNLGNGAFKDTATAAGVAFSEAGVARAGMGVDAGDYDDSGRPSLIVGNFSNESLGLYRNEGGGLFIDDAPLAGLAQSSLLTLSFGLFFFDYDLDGRLDVFVANGHVENEIQSVQPKVRYAQPPHLFHNLGGGRFRDVAPSAGAALRRALVARGAAYGDYDGDGDLDVAVSTNNGPAYLLRNDGAGPKGAPANAWLRVRTLGSVSNRDGIGAAVTLTLEDGRKLRRDVRSGSSYCSQSELPLTFGLGAGRVVPRLEVRWPSGRVDTLKDVAARRSLTVREGLGVR
jgi:hypothetical protein